MIPVTKPFLPPQNEYQEIISKIWKTQWLTNMGPLANKLEDSLKDFLKVDYLLFVTNGTIALQMAIRALELKGEIITTPFSFVATTSSIVWENCTPVFADISSETLNINRSKIEEKITANTSAILATHVYGNPCDVEEIERIAKKYNLKVIYDGAHAFGVQFKGKSIFEYGDISICSLHATKLYHSTEGGFIVTKDIKLNTKLDFIRNFGFDGPEAFAELGINGKNSEFHAAMGLTNINYIEVIHQKRKLLTEKYDQLLGDLNAHKPIWNVNSNLNYAYYPLVFETEDLMLDCMESLSQNGIIARRYFYPALSTSLPYVTSEKLEVTDALAKKILCLPLYFDLLETEVETICDVLLNTQAFSLVNSSNLIVEK